MKINKDLIISDTNYTLGQVETNTNDITNLKPVTLYESQYGSSSTFTLSESVNNYSKLLVTYGRTGGAQKLSILLDIENIGSASIPLIITDAGGSNFIIYGCRVSFSGTTVTITNNNGAREVLISNSAYIDTSDYYIYIHRVIGWK